MPINASPHFDRAQAEYEQAITTEQKIRCLKKMMSLAPKHKGAENLNAQLKKRLAHLKYAKEREDKSGKHKGTGIKKEDMQAVIVGKTNTGKSTLLKILTNASPETSENKFTTSSAQIGMMNYGTVQIQLIEIPAIDSENYDKGIVYTADTVLILIDNLKDLKEIEDSLKTIGKKILVFNKIDLFSQNELRKLEATLKSKYRKYNFILISAKNKINLEELKNKVFQSFGKIRIYTKEPGKDPDKKRPMILSENATVKEVSEKILKGFSKNVKQIKIWGPSSKFSGQIVGMKHAVKDLDIVEFKTK